MNTLSDSSSSDEGTGPVDRKAALADALKRRIVNMELAPGAVVDEVALSVEFGLSRPPVRELLRQMAAEGYIELEANRAARVSAMSYQSLRNFFLAAPMIYIATSQLAANNATAEDVARLKDIQGNFKAAIEKNDVESRVLYNDLFHLEIGLIARNEYLMPSLRRILIDHARLGKTFYRFPTTRNMQRDLDKAVEQHEEIIDAIARHDTDAVAAIVRDHLDLSRRRMTEYAVPVGVDVPLAL